ncbi:MAG: J domain-containing protein [Candidatus Hydrogenedentes bacterium]|nr:J domain-containing protein [Candidatus Hydrogenedentota bacterium]
MPSLQELLFLSIIILVLSMTGVWPTIIRGIRQLRGDAVEEPVSPAPPKDLDLCYRMLGISPTASWDEIERAYRRKAKVHHPDHGGDEDTMRALNEAFALLKRARSARR